MKLKFTSFMAVAHNIVLIKWDKSLDIQLILRRMTLGAILTENKFAGTHLMFARCPTAEPSA